MRPLMFGILFTIGFTARATASALTSDGALAVDMCFGCKCDPTTDSSCFKMLPGSKKSDRPKTKKESKKTEAPLSTSADAHAFIIDLGGKPFTVARDNSAQDAPPAPPKKKERPKKKFEEEPVKCLAPTSKKARCV